MSRRRTDPDQVLAQHGVPLAAPFIAASSGLSTRQLVALERGGHLRRLFREVYVRTGVVDTLTLRAQAIKLVLPPGAVVTDVSAAWLHNIDLLPPRDIYEVPDLHVFHIAEGGCIARAGVISGQRTMPGSDITHVDGVPVTTLLRTACDLGRLQWRERAFAALDALLRAGVDQDELLVEVERFRGYRGVRQLRAFAPLADKRSGSAAESIMRLRWLDSGLPPPQPQIPVDGPNTTWFLDLGVEELFYAIEYDGEEFHSQKADVQHDRERRDWMRAHTPWTIDVIGKETLFNDSMRFESMLREGVAEARRTVANRVRGRRWFIEPGD